MDREIHARFIWPQISSGGAAGGGGGQTAPLPPSDVLDPDRDGVGHHHPGGGQGTDSGVDGIAAFPLIIVLRLGGHDTEAAEQLYRDSSGESGRADVDQVIPDQDRLEELMRVLLQLLQDGH